MGSSPNDYLASSESSNDQTNVERVMDVQVKYETDPTDVNPKKENDAEAGAREEEDCDVG